MFRTLFIAIAITLYSIIVGIPLLLFTVVSLNPNPLYWAGVRGTVFFVRLAGVRFDIKGIERIPAGTCLFVANHTSSADAPAIVGAIPRRIAILLKKSLFKVPIVGQAFRLAHFIPVDRTQHEAAVAALEKATEALINGQSFLIYPEGTRSPDGRLQSFKKGAAVMAIKANVMVVPMVCWGAHRVMEKKSLVVHPGTIVVEFLEPIDAGKYILEERDALNDQIHDAMAAALPPDQRPVGFPGAA